MGTHRFKLYTLKEISNTSAERFGAKIVAQLEIKTAIFTLFSNRVYHVYIKKDARVSMNVVVTGYHFLEQHGGGMFYNIFEFDAYSEVDPKVRHWASGKTISRHTYCDAMVINGLCHKIVSDFYLNVTKPLVPTHVFNDLDEAIKWTLEQRDKTENQSMLA